MMLAEFVNKLHTHAKLIKLENNHWNENETFANDEQEIWNLLKPPVSEART